MAATWDRVRPGGPGKPGKPGPQQRESRVPPPGPFQQQQQSGRNSPFAGADRPESPFSPGGDRPARASSRFPIRIGGPAGTRGPGRGAPPPGPQGPPAGATGSRGAPQRPPRPPEDFVSPTQYHEEQRRRQQQQRPQQFAGSPPVQHPRASRPAQQQQSLPSSRAPPINTNFRGPPAGGPRRQTYDPTEISPPSSPDTDTPRGRNTRPQLPRDVSPIDDDDRQPSNMPRPGFASSTNSQGLLGSSGPQSRTNIPMMRRERRHQQDQAAVHLRASRSRSREDMRLGQPQDDRLSSISSNRGYKGGEVRWDPATGELTSSEKGRPSQVKSTSTYAKGLATSPSSSPPDPQSQISRNPDASKIPSASFGDRVQRIAQQSPAPSNDTDPAPGAFQATRPAWRGASGRESFVEPVQDVPDAPPLNIPRRGSRRAAGAQSPPAQYNKSQMSSTGKEPETNPENAESHSYPGVTVRTSRAGMQDTLPTENPSHSATSSFPSQTQTPTSLVSPLSSSHPAVRRKPAPSHGHDNSISSVSVYSHDIPESSARASYVAPSSENRAAQSAGVFSSAGAAALSPDAWAQPPSRFSVTTFATSAYNSSPRPSVDAEDAPPLPKAPGNFDEVDMYGNSTMKQSAPGSSVMDRKRPPRRRTEYNSEELVAGGPVVISLHTSLSNSNLSSAGTPKSAAAQERERAIRKPVGSAPRGPHHPLTSRPSSITSDIHKSLPPAPGEIVLGENATASERVAQLDAQLRNLGNRRINVTRSIKQMTELMPTDNILDSVEVIAKREMEKLKVERLRQDLAEIQREEYELGLKLHRAYKRLDRDAEYEPTSLWVRRVTG